MLCDEGDIVVAAGVVLLSALGLEEMLADELPRLISRSFAVSIKEAVVPFKRDPWPIRRRTLIDPADGGEASWLPEEKF